MLDTADSRASFAHELGLDPVHFGYCGDFYLMNWACDTAQWGFAYSFRILAMSGIAAISRQIMPSS